MPDILDKVNKKDVAAFRKDFNQLIRVAFGMDKGYGSYFKYMDEYMPRYKKLIGLFNKKYKKIYVKLSKGTEELRLSVFIDGGTIPEIFQGGASRISGLKSIGASGFGKADISSPEQFASELSRIKSSVYITYYEAEAGSNTIFLEYDPKEKKVEVHYEYKGISDHKSPTFKLCAFYAAHDFDRSIDFYSEAIGIGFTDLLSDAERKEWMDKFNPPWTE